MIVFYQLDGRVYEEIGRVDDGEIVAGEAEIRPIIYQPDLDDEEKLLEIHDGPHVLAQREETEDEAEKWLPYEEDGERGWIRADASETRFTDEAPGEIVKGFEEETSSFSVKEWVPYQGPQGGEGWQNTNDRSDIRYQDDPPGEVAEESEPDYEPAFEDTFVDEENWYPKGLTEGWKVLEEATDANRVFFHNLDKETFRNVGKSILDLNKSGYLDHIDEIRTPLEGDKYDDPDDIPDKAEATYDWTNREIILRPTAFDSKLVEERYSEGWWSSNDRMHNLHHEVGHHAHAMNHGHASRQWTRGYMHDFWSEMKDGERDVDREAIKNEVSEYAAFGPLEFVAETFAGKMAGEEYSDEILELYQDLNGPVIQS